MSLTALLCRSELLVVQIFEASRSSSRAEKVSSQVAGWRVTVDRFVQPHDQYTVFWKTNMAFSHVRQAFLASALFNMLAAHP